MDMGRPSEQKPSVNNEHAILEKKKNFICHHLLFTPETNNWPSFSSGSASTASTISSSLCLNKQAANVLVQIEAIRGSQCRLVCGYNDECLILTDSYLSTSPDTPYLHFT